jgi:methionyl-tRNA formyltransferase
MGTPETAVPTLKRCVEDGHEVVAVWTQPDRPAGRGNKLAAPPVKEYALSVGLPVYQPAKIKTDEALRLFSSFDADAAIVVAYGRILPSTFLCAPRRGCLNVHFSLLPKYRGAAPVNWAIVRGESESGVTTMLIDEGLDTGAILLQCATPIGETETAPQLLARLAVSGAELLSETLQRLDEIEPRVQREEDATHAPVLRREDGKIMWTENARSIERRVRGLQPWPNAYAEYESKRLMVWRAELVESVEARHVGRENADGEPLKNTGEAEERGAIGRNLTADEMFKPGMIVEARGERLVVACGEGSLLRLHEVQVEGKRRMSARDFLNGTRVNVGGRLG